MIASRTKLHINICITNPLQLKALKNDTFLGKGDKKERHAFREKMRTHTMNLSVCVELYVLRKKASHQEQCCNNDKT